MTEPAWTSLQRWAAAQPHAPLLVWPEGSLAYREAAARCRDLTAGLRAAGVRRRDRAVLAMGNDADSVLGLLALARLGATVLPLDPAAPPAEAQRAYERFRPVHRVDPRSQTVAGLAEAGADAEPGTPAGFAMVTSGVGGAPKVARRAWSATTATAAWFARLAGYQRRARVVCTTPLHHSYALSCGLVATLWAGGSLFLAPASLTPAGWLAAIAEAGTGVVLAVPFLYRCLLEASQGGVAAAPGCCVTAGEALDPALAAGWRERFGTALRNHYGTTETGMISLNADGTDLSAGSVLPGVRVRVVDPETGARAARGGSGVLDVRSEGQRPLCYGLRGLAAESVRDGWFLTDDIGRVDPHGRLVVEGRRGRRVNVAGNKVDPGEVESALLALPGIREAVVVGAPRSGTEEVWAFLTGSDELRMDEVRRALAGRLSRYKLPRRLVMLDALPRTASGKVRVGALLASIGDA